MNKKSLFGYGVTTKAIAKSGGWDIYDDKFNSISKDEFQNNLFPSKNFNPKNSSLEITSPGINPNHPLTKEAKNLISEYDYFKDISPFSIWISGTNGKTTTTKMLNHQLEKLESCMGGNVGKPLGDLDKNAKIWILETSSFTIHYTKKASPEVYLLLPITPDHIDWHNSFKEYEQTKLKPLSMMNESCVAIIPQKYENIKTDAKIITYKDEYDLAKQFNIKIEKVNFKTPFLLDAILTLCVEKILLDYCDIEHLNKFIIEGNKLEEIRDKFDRIWVNDTKATNVDSSLQALKRYKDKKIYLIMGGVDKGLKMDDIFDYIKNKNIAIYAIGSNAGKLKDLAKNFNVNFTNCTNLENAVSEITKKLKTDEVALLSPAAASFDQFNSYAHRGEVFKKLIKNL